MSIFKISNILNIIDIGLDMSTTAVYNILEGMKPARAVVK